MPKKILISAETGSDITRELAQELGIILIPMHVSMGSETLDDAVRTVLDAEDAASPGSGPDVSSPATAVPVLSVSSVLPVNNEIHLQLPNGSCKFRPTC